MRAYRTILALTFAAFVVGAPLNTEDRRNVAWARTRALQFAGTNLIVGTELLASRVTLTKPGELHERDVDPFVDGPRPNVRIEGGGRVAGLILIEDVRDPLDAEDPSFAMWMRGGFCRTEGCHASQTHTYATGGGLRQGPGKKVFLRPGNYFLYLVADGAPVQVTLELGGLSGTRQIAPKLKARGEVRTPEVRMSAGTERQAHWFGEEYAVHGEGGLTYSAMQVKTNDWLAGEVGWCAYVGEPDPGPLAYAPVCPSGFTYTTPIVRVPPMRVEVLDRGMSRSDFDGRFGFGHHLLTTGAVERVDGIFFFLDFDRSDFR